MSEQSDIIGIGGILGGIIAMLSAVGQFLFNYRKQTVDNQKTATETDLRVNEQALAFYKDMIKRLQVMVEKSSKDQEELWKEHLTCREHNVKLRVELQFLKDKYEHSNSNQSGGSLPPASPTP